MRAAYAPDDATVAEVRAFAGENGLSVTSVPANRLYVQTSGSVAAVQKAFGTTLQDRGVAVGEVGQAADRDHHVEQRHLLLERQELRARRLADHPLQVGEQAPLGDHRQQPGPLDGVHQPAQLVEGDLVLVEPHRGGRDPGDDRRLEVRLRGGGGRVPPRPQRAPTRARWVGANPEPTHGRTRPPPPTTIQGRR